MNDDGPVAADPSSTNGPNGHGRGLGPGPGAGPRRGPDDRGRSAFSVIDLGPARPTRRMPSLGALRRQLREPQHRDATLLMANTGLAAGAGLLFWLLLTRVLDLPPAEVGVGYAIVAVGTTIGLLAKGGLDTAVVRAMPSADPATARRLLALAVSIACGTALLVAAALTLAGQAGHALAPFSGAAWLGATAIGLLLAAAWLLDAYFLAAGAARVTLVRTAAGSVVRITLPLLAVQWFAPGPVAWAWALGLLASVLTAIPFLLRRAPSHDPLPSAAAPERSTTPGGFLATANRNLAASAAEFLPGLLLAPIVLAIDGPASAAYFGMAWTIASLLFLAAAAVGRSALTAMARPSASIPAAIRRGVLQAGVVVAGGALIGIAVAPFVLGVFGADYAREAGLAFALLCASAVVVAPGSLYLSVLRMRERTATLVAVPIATMALLLGLVPILEAEWGLAGVAVAWILANLPFGLWSAYRLFHEGRQVPAAGQVQATPQAKTSQASRVPAVDAQGVNDA